MAEARLFPPSASFASWSIMLIDGDIGVVRPAQDYLAAAHYLMQQGFVRKVSGANNSEVWEKVSEPIPSDFFAHYLATKAQQHEAIRERDEANQRLLQVVEQSNKAIERVTQEAEAKALSRVLTALGLDDLKGQAADRVRTFLTNAAKGGA